MSTNYIYYFDVFLNGRILEKKLKKCYIFYHNIFPAFDFSTIWLYNNLFESLSFLTVCTLASNIWTSTFRLSTAWLSTPQHPDVLPFCLLDGLTLRLFDLATFGFSICQLCECLMFGLLAFRFLTCRTGLLFQCFASGTCFWHLFEPSTFWPFAV